MTAFWLCLVSLFVAVDVVGIVPMYITLTAGIDEQRKRRIVIQSVVTAVVVASAFLFIGRQLLAMLGVTVADFMVAGGILLFLFSVSDILSAEKKQRQVDQDSVGAVPLGVPLIVGPAVLTTLLILEGQHGWLPTLSGLLVNMVITTAVLWFSGWFMRILGATGARVLSKLASLLMAAIGVMIVRRGIEQLMMR